MGKQFMREIGIEATTNAPYSDLSTSALIAVTVMSLMILTLFLIWIRHRETTHRALKFTQEVNRLRDQYIKLVENDRKERRKKEEAAKKKKEEEERKEKEKKKGKMRKERKRRKKKRN